MSGLDAERAYVLHRRPYREKDLWLELWSRKHGKLPVIAHRVRSAARQAELSPFAELRVWTRGQSEMATLKEWEVLLSRRPLVGRNALTGLYINELLYRALPRGEAEPGLFDQYGELLDLLHREPGVAEAQVDPGGPDSIQLAIENALRRLELGLLAGLGYGLQLAQTHDGHAVLSSAQYAVDLESGVRLLADAPWSGELLLSLAAMQQIDHRPAGPPLELRRQQRRLLRSLLQQMLGERPLASWGMVRGFGAGPRPG